MARTATRVACGAGLLGLALTALAAGGPEWSAGGPDRTASGALELRLEVRSALGRNARRFAAGEPVTFVLEIENTGATPLALEFATARTHDFSVLDPEGREVWRWSRGRLFAQALATIELAAGETRRFAAAWAGR